MSLVEYAKKMGISNERAVEAYRRRSDFKRDDVDGYTHDSSGTETPDLDDVLKTASSMSTPPPQKAISSHKGPELLSHFIGVPTDKARRKEVPVAPFDHSLDNERSMTALLGAILTKQMREIRAKEAARAAQKNRPRPSNSPLAALKRTMSGKALDLGLEEMTDSQQLPNSSRFRGEPLTSPTWSVSERAKQKEKEEQEEESSLETKETPSVSSKGRMVSSMRAVPSLKDVFRFTDQQPLRMRISEEISEEQQEVKKELEEIIIEQENSLDIEKIQKTSIDEEREITIKSNDDDDDGNAKKEEETSKRSIKDIFPKK